MLEIYSNNISVEANATVPLNTLVLRRGCTALWNGTNGINLTKQGVYMVTVNADVTSATVGDYSLAIYKDGVALPYATATNSIATADDYAPLSISVLIPVNHNSGYCINPSTITIVNTGLANKMNVTVIVTKVV